MVTVWDWLTIFAFAGLVTLFLERSSKPVPQDKLWHYAPPAIACAVANQIGNGGRDLVAALILASVVIYALVVLKVRMHKH